MYKLINQMERTMNHNHFHEVVEALKIHPILGFIICFVGAVITATAPVQSHFEYPIWLMQTGQLLAWIAVCFTAVITFLGALEKYCGITIKIDLKRIFKKKKNG